MQEESQDQSDVQLQQNNPGQQAVLTPQQQEANE